MSRFDDIMDGLYDAKIPAPHATHYQQLSPEPITIIEAWGLDYCLGNALKYIARAEFKGSKKADLEKAVWYIQRKIEKECNEI